jgi:hypothetical protein
MPRSLALSLLAVMLVAAGCEQWSMLSLRSSNGNAPQVQTKEPKNYPEASEPMTWGSHIWYADEPSHLDPQKITGGIQ